MKRLPVLFALLLPVFFSCRKQQQQEKVTPGPEQSVTGYLRYYSITYDGSGLYYQKDIPANATDSFNSAAWHLLISNGKDGYIVDGEGVESSFHQYIDKHTLLRYRETGRHGCGSSSIAGYNCPDDVPVIDTLAFTEIP